MPRQGAILVAVWRWLKIERGEGTRLALLTLYSAAAVGGIWAVGFAVGESLFLSALPASLTPLMFILSAISNIVFLLLYGAILARVRLRSVVLGSTAALVLAVLIFRALLASPIGHTFPVLAALYLLVDISAVLAGIQFWTYAAQVFNARQARRHFSRIAAGGTLANVLAGLSMAVLVRHIGIENLLYIVAASLVVCAGCAIKLDPMLPVAPGARAGVPRPSQSLKAEAQAVWRVGLLKAVAALTILTALLVNLCYYQFYLALQAHFAGQGRSMIVFLGAYQSIAGLAALVVQFAIAGRVIRRFGIFIALMFFPIGISLGSAAALISAGALLAVAAIQSTMPVIRQTINDAALNVLYLPVAANLRRQAKNLMQVLFAITYGLAGVAFLLLEHLSFWRYYYWSAPLIAVAALTIALAAWMRGPYAASLAISVNRRRFDEAEAFEIKDDASVRALALVFRDPNELHVLHALELIEYAPSVDWDPHVEPLLAHPSAVVRETALRHLGRSGNSAYAGRVAPFLAASELPVRVAAIDALCAILGPGATPQVVPFLAAREPRARGAAVAGLILHGGEAAYGAAIDVLAAMLRAADPAFRQDGARVLGRMRADPLRPLLPPLFDDPDPGVRRCAIEAAKALGGREHIPRLVASLADHETVPAAIEALAVLGDVAVPALAAALAHAPDTMRANAPRALDRIGTLEARAALMAHLDEPDLHIGAAIYRALAAIQARGLEPAPAPEPLRAAARALIGGYYAAYLARADLNAAGDYLLLDDILAWRMSGILDQVFYLLVTIYPGKRLERVREVLDDPEHHARAMAIELLDTVVERTIAELLLPLVEGKADAVEHVASQRFDLAPCPIGRRLAAQARGGDRWPRACAIYYIGVHRHYNLSRLVDGALEDDDNLTRETALMAKQWLLPPQAYRELLRQYAADPGCPTTRRFATSMLREKEVTMTRSTIERVLLLKRVDLFSRIPTEDLVAVADVAEEVEFASGETFIRQGDVGECLYVLVAGEVRVEIAGLGEVAVRRPTGTIGEMALIARQPRSADCTAIGDVTALRIDHDPFWDLMSDQRSVALGIIELLAQRINNSTEQMQKLKNGLT